MKVSGLGTGFWCLCDDHFEPCLVWCILNGGQSFAKLDVPSAYRQVLLDEESRQYITINTHLGLFRYTRLPFGVAACPAIFQQTMDSMLSGLNGVGVSWMA